MSGNQRRLIRIQAVMACGMMVLSLFLIPRWGIVGAASRAAVTNAATNIWYLGKSGKGSACFRTIAAIGACCSPWLASLRVLVAMRVTCRAVRLSMGGDRWPPCAGVRRVLAVAITFGLDADDRSHCWRSRSRCETRFKVQGKTPDVERRRVICVCRPSFARCGAALCRTASVGLEELLVFVLQELLRDQAAQMDQAEQRVIEQRLKDLGIHVMVHSFLSTIARASMPH